MDTQIKIVENVLGDELGPEFILHWYNPEVNVKGIIVVDTVALGMGTGGTRMLPDITTEELCILARGMTYKKVMMGLMSGGAKAGIWEDPNVKNPRREAILRAYGRVIKPLFQAKVARCGADMGISFADVEVVGEVAGYPKPPTTNFLLEPRDGEPLENHFTGYGVVVAAKTACEFVGIDMSKAKVAIEGFGKVGGGVARYFDKAGARVVALSTILGGIYNEKGLDMAKLFELRRSYGDECILKYKDAQKIEKEELFYLPVDILVPGGRPYVITESNVNRIKAKVISSGANEPATDGALDTLHQKGVMVVPDYIANSGGATASLSCRTGLNVEQTFVAIERMVGGNARDILQASARTKVNPTRMANERVLDKIRQAKKSTEPISYEAAVSKFREIVKL